MRKITVTIEVSEQEFQYLRTHSLERVLRTSQRILSKAAVQLQYVPDRIDADEVRQALNDREPMLGLASRLWYAASSEAQVTL